MFNSTIDRDANSRLSSQRWASMTESSAGSPKSMSISALLTMLWVTGLFISLLWSPVLVADAIEQSKLAKLGIDTEGKVESHGRGRRRNADYFWTSVGYEVASQKYIVSLKGEGAAAARLPLGTPVKVRYLPSKPSYSTAQVKDASSGGGPGWTGLFIIWGTTFLCALGDYLIRQRKKAKSTITPNPLFQRTASGGW